MTPDALHYAFVVASWIAIPILVIAAVLLHRRVRSCSSGVLLAGLLVVLVGQVVQLFSPVNDLGYDEFRGIIVSSGKLPLTWYAGSLVSSSGLLLAAAGALGVALTAPRRSREDRKAAA